MPPIDAKMAGPQRIVESSWANVSRAPHAGSSTAFSASPCPSQHRITVTHHKPGTAGRLILNWSRGCSECPIRAPCHRAWSTAQYTVVGDLLRALLDGQQVGITAEIAT